MRRQFPYDQKRMILTLQNIVTDMLRHPGQAGLGEDEKFALTMIMLARLCAVIVAGNSPSPRAAQQLEKLLFEAISEEREASTALIEGAKMLGFGSSLPWSIIQDLLVKEDD